MRQNLLSRTVIGKRKRCRQESELLVDWVGAVSTLRQRRKALGSSCGTKSTILDTLGVRCLETPK